jgi:hypothetical protein
VPPELPKAPEVSESGQAWEVANPAPAARHARGWWALSQRTRLGVVLGVGLALVVCVFFAGKALHLWAPENSLRPLKQDPLAAEDLLGMKLIRSNENSGAGLFNWLVLFDSNPNQTFIMREFAVDSPEDTDAAVDQITQYALDNGWEQETQLFWDSETPDLIKPHGKKTMVLTIYGYKYNNAVGVRLGRLD